MRAKRMEDRQLPIYFESVWSLRGRGKIIEILPRTEHTRRYRVKWDSDGQISVYKGAATRPWWIKHILREDPNV